MILGMYIGTNCLCMGMFGNDNDDELLWFWFCGIGWW